MKSSFRLLACALSVIALAVFAAGCAGGGGKGREASRPFSDSISYYYTGADTSTRFICNSTLLADKLGGEPEAFLTCDGTVGITRVGTGLYRVDKDGVLMIHPAGVNRALLSLDGNIIVFTTATEVHVYDHRTGQVQDIKPDGAASVKSIVLSPDGGTVGYTVRSADGSLTAYAYSDGASRRLSDNAYIIGVADGAAWWYYLTPDADVYYAADGGQKRIGSDASTVFEFNRDLSEVTFDMNGVTYFSMGGRSAKRIAEGKSVFPTAGPCSSAQGGEDCTAYVRDCGSLFDAVFYSCRAAVDDELDRNVYDLWYVSGTGKVTALARGAYQFAVQTDGNKLTCLVDSTLYRMDTDDPSTSKSVCTNVYTFAVSRDGSEIYCIGYDRKLYYIKDLGKPKELLSEAVHCLITDEGKCLCIADYDGTGTLYFADGENDPVVVGREVYLAETKPAFCCYYSAPYGDDSGNRVFDLYSSADGHSFELLLKGVKLYND